MIQAIFWAGLLGIIYAYFLYPAVLFLLGRLLPKAVRIDSQVFTPSVSLIMPVHNEENIIRSKLDNFRQLEYPEDKFKLIIVSDGCTDRTIDIIQKCSGSLNVQIVEVNERRGKANALNTGLQYVDTELVVFSDASILLETDALKQLVKPFEDPLIGCVSGEDHIAEMGGEGLYGRYELFLRNQESSIGSIVGASGSFYAQRTEISQNFEEGLAPDFLSVLNTVKAGYRAITEPRAIGHMTASKSSGQEFQRKVRTLLRGMTALFSRPALLNPLNYGLFSLFLISHKLLRWLVPLFLISVLVSNMFLLEHSFYKVFMLAQVLFYLLALLAFLEKASFQNILAGKIPLFFIMVNVAISAAWVRYLRGDRQELWAPTQRNEAG